MTRENLYIGNPVTFTHNGKKYVAEVLPDSDMGAPWLEHEGHGPVSDWTRAAKAPGELVLNGDGRGGLGTDSAHRFYDFAEACRIARRDGWGFLPGELRTQRVDGKWRAWVDGKVRLARAKNSAGQYRPARRVVEKRFLSVSPDLNTAISEVYAKHRATLTPRQYAAGAAMADFKRLRDWCADQWEWVGVRVRRADACTCCGESESLWGIESDAGAYLWEVAEELAEELDAGSVTDCAA